MKIGVTAPGSSTNMFVNVLLAKDGLKPDDVAIIGVGATAGAVAIMKRGEIDAIVQSRPGDLDAGGGRRHRARHRHAHGEGYAGRLRRRLRGRCIYVPVDFAKKYPNTAQAFVNAMMRALRFIQTSTPDQIVAAVPPDYYTDKALYKAALEKNIDTYKHDGSISLEAGRNVLRDLKTFDPTVQNATVDVAKTINMTFQQKAAQKYR